MIEIDDLFYMMGDEDTDVGLHCRLCDRGGLPVVYYTTSPNNNYYEKSDVVVVNNISQFFRAGVKHYHYHKRIPT